MVLARGQLNPCDLCYVGEAPGDSEDSLGKPFVGPAGKRLDKINRKATAGITYCQACLRGHCPAYEMDNGEGRVTCANGHYGKESRSIRIIFTNLLACIPRDAEGNKDEMDHEAVEKCTPRLEEFLNVAKPRLIVAVGKWSREYLEQGFRHSVKVPKSVQNIVNIVHPSHILRLPIAQQGGLEQRCEVTIRKALEKL